MDKKALDFRLDIEELERFVDPISLCSSEIVMDLDEDDIDEEEEEELVEED